MSSIFPPTAINGDQITLPDGTIYEFSDAANGGPRWDKIGGSGGSAVWASDGAGGYKLDTSSITDAMVIDDSGVVTLADDSVLALGASATTTTTLQTLSNTNGIVGSLQASGNDFVAKIGQASGAFYIDANSGADLFKITNGGIITGTGSVPASITGGTSDGIVVSDDGRFYFGSDSNGFKAQMLFYNPSGQAASMGSNDIDFFIKPGNAGGDIYIRNYDNTDDALRIREDGLITGTSSVPTDITTGAVDGLVIDNLGSIRMAKDITPAQTHIDFFNPNGLIAELQTSSVDFVQKLGTTGAFKHQDSSGNNLLTLAWNGIITGTSSNPIDGTQDGLVIQNLGQIRSSRNTTSAAPHRYFYNPNGLIAELQTSGRDFLIKVLGDVILQSNDGAYAIILDETSGTFFANSDNTQANGSASKRWSVIYAGTGSINTSDETEKTFHELSEDQEWDKVLNAVEKTEIKAFQFNDAIELKGAENARMHFGVGAQTLKANLEAEGLDPFKYAVLCWDEWEAEYEDVFETEIVTPAKEAVLDEEGNVLEEAVEEVTKEVKVGEKCVLEAGSRYGIRYDEFQAIKAAVYDRKIQQLETRLAALEV